MISRNTEEMNVVQLAALSTTLLKDKNIIEAKETYGSEKDYRYIIIKDVDQQKYILVTPKKEKYTNKFLTDIYNTKILKDKYIVPEIIADNNKIAIYKTYIGTTYDITILDTLQIKSLAKNIAKLHTLSYKIVEQNKIPSWTNEQLVKNLFDVLDEAKNTGKISSKIIDKFEETLESSSLWNFNSAVINGNINDKSIIFNDKKVVNILDWHALQYSDPAIDLCSILPRISKENKKIFLKEYNKEIKKYSQHNIIDVNIDERAEFYADFKLLSDYLVAKANNDEKGETEALKRLKQLEKTNYYNEELNKVEQNIEQQNEKQQIRELESKINDEQKTEMLNTTALENGKLRQTNDKAEENPKIDTDSEIEKELLQMLNNESGKVNLRTRESINTQENKIVEKKKFSISEYTGEIKEKNDDNTVS